jgi:hypothetical protein
LNLEFEIDEQLHVLVQGSNGDYTVSVVFEEYVLEIGCTDGFVTDGKNGRFILRLVGKWHGPDQGNHSEHSERKLVCGFHGVG